MSKKKFSQSNQFFAENLLNKKGYAIHAPQVEHKLDQNECYHDWSGELKHAALQRLEKMEWNRYPEAFSVELEKKLADSIGIDPACVLTGPGSDYLGVLLLKAFSFGPAKIHIASPTFPVYVIQANLHGFEYELWPLNDDLEYDFTRLNLTKDDSHVVIFASPNNPTGGVVPVSVLKNQLKANPNTIFVADEAYFEFADESFLPLLEEYSNLIVMRTASKTLASAGVRFGYICGADEVISQIRKFRLPYCLNHLTTAAINEFIESDVIKQKVGLYCQEIKTQRAWLLEQMEHINPLLVERTYPSWANFILLRFTKAELKDRFYNELIEKHSMLVRDVSKAHQLERCLRFTIGLPEQNQLFVKALKEFKTSE